MSTDPIDDKIIERAATILADRIAADEKFIGRLANSCRIHIKENDLIKGLLGKAKQELEQEVATIKNNARQSVRQNFNVWLGGYFESRIKHAKDDLVSRLKDEDFETLVRARMDDAIVSTIRGSLVAFLRGINVKINLADLYEEDQKSKRLNSDY